ncbi:MAG: WD40 repeat domain-containing protein [Acidobacteriota bacterium]
MSDPSLADLPAVPYPGIEPFSYAEREVFFARSAESRKLIRLITLYRGVLLYATSGLGKSSLVNAGLIPRAIDEGYQPERLRVQSRPGEEILAEPIHVGGDGAAFLPSILCEGGRPAVLSVEAFLETLRGRAAEARPLLIFDQFEEWATLFDREPACRTRIVDMLASLLNDPQLPVKILIVLREDYLASLQPLFERWPNLPDYYVRLKALEGEGLRRAIRGPFEDHPGVYAPEIGPDLAARVQEQLASRAEGGVVPLTEVQIVCRSLFEAGRDGRDTARLFEERGVQGLLEDSLEGALSALGRRFQDPAVALLGRMITSANTRNVIAQDDLLDLAQEDGFSRESLAAALDLLERRTRLVSKELRREVYFYEIVSEFLVPWILRKKERLRLAREERARRRWRRIAAGLAAMVLAVAALAVFAGLKYREAERQKQLRISQLLAEESGDALIFNVPRALLLAVESIRRARRGGGVPSAESEESLRSALAHAPGHALGSGGKPAFDTALSPDGLWLAGTGKGGRLYLWPATREGLAGPAEELAGYEGGLQALAVSPDARWVAAANEGRVTFLWRRSEDDRPRRLPTDVETDSLLFSAGSDWLIAFGEDGVPRFYSLEAGSESWSLELSRRECTPTHWSHGPSALWLAIGCDDGAVVAWDLSGARPRELQLQSSSPEAVSALAFSTDESRLATGHLDGSVQLWDLSSRGAPLRLNDLASDDQEVTALAFHPDGHRLAAGKTSGGVRLWTLVAGQAQSPKPAVSGGQRAELTWSRDGRWIFARGPDGTFLLWSLAPSGQLVPDRQFPAGVVAGAFSQDGRWLAAGDREGNLFQIDLLQPGEAHRVERAFEPEIRSLAFGRGGLLFTRSLEGPPRLWDFDGRNPAGGDEPRISRAPVTALVPEPATTRSSSGWRIEAASDIPRLWSPQEPRKAIILRRHDGGVTARRFSADGKWLLTGSADGVAHLWSLDRIRRLVLVKEEPDPVKTTQHQGAVTEAVFSPDGRWLLTVGGSAVLWRLGENVSLQGISGHPGRIGAGAISSDSRWLATADDRGTVRLWDLAQPSLRSVDLPGHGTRNVTRLWFDRATVQAVDGQGLLRRWRTDLGELIDLACRTVGRGFTSEEWDQVLAGEDYDGLTCPDFPVQSPSS